MNIRISADSTCDLSPELIEKYDIRITPLYIVRDGQSLVDGKDITPDEIYAHVNSGGRNVQHGGGVGVRLYPVLPPPAGGV